MCVFDGLTHPVTHPAWQVGVYRGHAGSITCLCLHEDLLLSASADGTVRKWRQDSPHCQQVARTARRDVSHS